ncbi:hypothetical protein [Halorientalis sp. IM1011]|uniref:hypothetical protein n=1 Tax=Halorientalis sp. IM1011 TaxID=1932360 RepID=UPI0012FCE6DD|nr:hypothetical protein [Halorientalis sp. IM1011]
MPEGLVDPLYWVNLTSSVGKLGGLPVETSMSTEKRDSDRNDVQPVTEPAPTPLISAAQFSLDQFPLHHVEQNRFYPLREYAVRIADTTSGTTENHLTGLIGEDAIAHHLGIEQRLNTEVYADGGDGGVDLTYRGATIDVKTVGRHRSNPALTVDAYEPLTADYYVLASRIGKVDCRLIGYAPRWFVANAPIQQYHGKEYHIVDQDYLFPIPTVRG